MLTTPASPGTAGANFLSHLCHKHRSSNSLCIRSFFRCLLEVQDFRVVHWELEVPKCCDLPPVHFFPDTSYWPPQLRTWEECVSFPFLFVSNLSEVCTHHAIHPHQLWDGVEGASSQLGSELWHCLHDHCPLSLETAATSRSWSPLRVMWNLTFIPSWIFHPVVAVEFIYALILCFFQKPSTYGAKVFISRTNVPAAH